MLTDPCRCNWGIHGVDALPDHVHLDAGAEDLLRLNKGSQRMVDIVARHYLPEIRIDVDRKAVARSRRASMAP